MRTHIIYVTIIAALAALYFVPPPPRTFTECREDAARNAKSKEAMYVLIDVCRRKFPSPSTSDVPSTASGTGSAVLAMSLPDPVIKGLGFGLAVLLATSLLAGIQGLYVGIKRLFSRTAPSRSA